MALDAVGGRADREHLNRAARVARQHAAVGGQPGNLIRVPLQGLEPALDAGEQRVLAALGGELDVADADLRRRHRAHLAAHRLGQELGPETDAEDRHAALADGLADGALLGHQPGIGILLPGIHRAAHDAEDIVAVERRNLLALVKLDRVPGNPVLGEEIPENAGMLDRDVLKDQDAHGGASSGPERPSLGRPRSADGPAGGQSGVAYAPRTRAAPAPAITAPPARSQARAAGRAG